MGLFSACLCGQVRNDAYESRPRDARRMVADENRPGREREPKPAGDSIPLRGECARVMVLKEGKRVTVR